MPRLGKKEPKKKIRLGNKMTAAGRKRLLETLQSFHRWRCYANAEVLARYAEIKKELALVELELMVASGKLDEIKVSYNQGENDITENCYQLSNPMVKRKTLADLYIEIEEEKPKKRRKK